MASSEILSYIPANIYEDIKSQDSKPVFRAYIVGHEGESEGKVVGSGNIVKRWFKSAIEKIVGRLQYGTKVFHEHGETNVHEGRKTIGHIVGKATKMIKDRLSAVAIAYIKPEFRSLPLDVASIEADVYLSGDQDKGIYDADVEDITGVALGNSSFNRPGFPGATLLASFQAFAQSQFHEGGGDMVTINEVRDFIKSESLKPSDIFGLGDLTKDPMIEEHLKAEKKKALQGEFDGRKRDEQGYERLKEKMIEDHKAEMKEKEELIDKLKQEGVQAKTKDWFEQQKEKRELNDEQSKFINRNLAKFKVEDPEKAEDEFGKFLDDQIDELNGIKKEVFDEEVEEEKKGDGGDPSKKKAGDDLIDEMSLGD